MTRQTRRSDHQGISHRWGAGECQPARPLVWKSDGQPVLDDLSFLCTPALLQGLVVTHGGGRGLVEGLALVSGAGERRGTKSRALATPIAAAPVRASPRPRRTGQPVCRRGACNQNGLRLPPPIAVTSVGRVLSSRSRVMTGAGRSQCPQGPQALAGGLFGADPCFRLAIRSG